MVASFCKVTKEKMKKPLPSLLPLAPSPPHCLVEDLECKDLGEGHPTPPLPSPMSPVPVFQVLSHPIVHVPFIGVLVGPKWHISSVLLTEVFYNGWNLPNCSTLVCLRKSCSSFIW